MTQRDFFSFCRSLRLIELKAIGDLSEVRHFREGARIYYSGDRGEEIFIINRGAVELLPEKSHPGAPATVLSRGDIFGEMGALMGLPRDHSVRACAPVSVQCFYRGDFPELLLQVPSFFLFLSEKLASRLFQATELVRSHNSAFELTGSLTNFDVVTVYQTIQQSRQTGLLKIAQADGATMAEFYFEKGAPRWGRFEHLLGEEAFWQLFLDDTLAASFSFSHVKEALPVKPGAELTRSGEDLLINAIHMRDQLADVRRRLRDSSVTLLRQQDQLTWNNPELADLKPAAEAIWQLAYSRPIELGDLYAKCGFCQLKIYQTVDELVRTEQVGLGISGLKGMLVAAPSRG
ncbi:MAG TPA: cyclic nucleotide-binding domain-containing protein [Chthoniobacterales bacterium]